MSYQTITKCTQDQAFMDRVTACVAQEAWNSPTNSATEYGASVRASSANAFPMVWPVAVDNEAAYESALVAGNPDPGGDPAVITDGAILSAVQSNWPPDSAP